MSRHEHCILIFKNNIYFSLYNLRDSARCILQLVLRIIVNKKSVTYCQQVLFIVKVFCVHEGVRVFVEVECRGSNVEGQMSRVEGKKSRVEGKKSRVEGKKSRVK